MPVQDLALIPIEYIVQYLKVTHDIGITLNPNKKEAFEVYADADFSGNWIKNYAELHLANAKSHLDG